MNQRRQSLLRTILQDLGILLLAMVVAVLARKLLLGALGTRIVWVTFYPAVMIAFLINCTMISVVAELNPALGGILEHQAGQFKYPAILQALQSYRSVVLKEEAPV